MTAAGQTTAEPLPDEVRKPVRAWALAVLGLYLLSAVAFAAFNARGGVWLGLNDAAALGLATATLVLVLQLDELFRPRLRRLASLAAVVGVLAMGLAMVGSTVLLATRAFGDVHTAPLARTGVVGGRLLAAESFGLALQVGGWGLQGVWLLLIGRMSARTRLFGDAVAWSSRAAGAASVVALFAVVPLGPDSLLVQAVSIVALLAMVAWLAGVQRTLRPDRAAL